MITNLLRNIYNFFTITESLEYKKSGILSRCTKVSNFTFDTDIINHRFSFDGCYESFARLINYIINNFENQDSLLQLAQRDVFNYLNLNEISNIIIMKDDLPFVVIKNYKVINPFYDYSIIIN